LEDSLNNIESLKTLEIASSSFGTLVLSFAPGSTAPISASD